ncbi:MAG: type II toxin-antitoxin system ParD family antitoxin [Desulfovibrionaceae bacterium]|jgi:antitoxin ParD1/3/4|nr:type II toxin-antitoxin system ParD family antitoxin [Desulfovibrionaceae bacterium]
MPAVEKISIALTPDLAALVRQAVENGDYASSSEVIRDALRDWKHKRAMQRQQMEELRRLWTEGLGSGPGRFSGMDAIREEAWRRFSDARRDVP